MIEICILIRQFQLNISHPSLKVPRLFQLTQTFPQSTSFLSSFSNPILTDAFQSCTKEEWQQQEETSLYQFS